MVGLLLSLITLSVSVVSAACTAAPGVGTVALEAAMAARLLLGRLAGVASRPEWHRQCGRALAAQPCAVPEVEDRRAGRDNGHARPRWVDALGDVRSDWTREEVGEVFASPLLELVFKAQTVHRMYHDPRMVQRCTLLNIKSGGCPEDCKYCSQSSKWSKDVDMKAEKLMDLDSVLEAAQRAKAAGSTRFCMGAAWRGPSQVGPRQWERVLKMVKEVKAMGMEVCTTLGMVTPEQARQLKEAGLTAYNHNLDTSPEYYSKITTTRKYEDRLNTLEAVREAGIGMCAGGIIGLGEGIHDRVGLLHQLASLPVHPDSVPINRLVAIKGTPMQDEKLVDSLDLVRCIATARIVMPRSMVRLAAGRLKLSLADQGMCFMAGANSIFSGDQLLTTPNNDKSEDDVMFQVLGLMEKPYNPPKDALHRDVRMHGKQHHQASTVQ
ncbi:unnamed protein product [Ostreobium quekettii]|uniref:biotin synthase n=1 Tax=Ostreobium quekettii TaxID=121088 RepID=A0A8S1J8G8_9CHLO|nr:unnamed protein product [Ostreobium quekettii]|eukprot:evm.model.scf_3473.2 EVM.evm.TU.scf_3473.2   scf_3473:8154-11806(+)